MAPTEDAETVDAQGRGRADNIDPADQWVINPNTGEYELRLTPSAPQSAVPGPRRPMPTGTPVGGVGVPPETASGAVPGQRRRRSETRQEPSPLVVGEGGARRAATGG